MKSIKKHFDNRVERALQIVHGIGESEKKGELVKIAHDIDTIARGIEKFNIDPQYFYNRVYLLQNAMEKNIITRPKKGILSPILSRLKKPLEDPGY